MSLSIGFYHNVEVLLSISRLWYLCFCYCLFHIALVLLSGVFRVLLSDHHHRVDACLMLLHASFNFDSKNERNLGLTCRCHLSNINRGSTFYDSVRLCFFVVLWIFFWRGDNHCLPQHKRDGSSLLIITPIGWRKLETIPE